MTPSLNTQVYEKNGSLIKKPPLFKETKPKNHWNSMNFQKLLFIRGLEQSRRDLLQMILPIGEKIIFYFEKSHEDSYKNAAER